MKRFWTQAARVAVEDGYGITLDSRPVKKPGGAPLVVPVAPLADAIAAEWQAAGIDGRDIGPDDLPLTRLATTALDRISTGRDAIIAQLAAYGLNDLLCYRAEAPALADRESAAWQPWLDWTARTYGVTLATGIGITAVQQPPKTAEKFVAALEKFSKYQLAALGVLVPVLGSLILGLAMAAQKLDPDSAFRTALLDELFQAAHWGRDDLAEASRAAILTDLKLGARFLTLCESEK